MITSPESEHRPSTPSVTMESIRESPPFPGFSTPELSKLAKLKSVIHNTPLMPISKDIFLETFEPQ